MNETTAAVKTLDELREAGKVLTLRKARKEHQCSVCPEPIRSGERYYEIVEGGSGLGRLKFPDRVHLLCINKYPRS